jgi:MFS family permease
MRASGGPGRFAALFNDGRGSATSLLWATFFCNMAMMYFFISWLPSLFAAEGLSPVRAIAATSVFNAGGVMGGLGMALMARRTPATAVLAGGYLLAAASIVTLAGGAAGTLLSYMAFGAGVGVVGGQFLLNGLVAQFYPAEIRATGLGVASGVGRMGAVLAPFAGGLLMTAHPQISDAFMMTAALALLAALAVVLAGRAQRQVRPEPSVVHPMNL